MRLYSFENLEAWKEGKALTIWIYNITNRFPEEEKFGLSRQLRRASISVVSNIAEGSARSSPKSQAHYYEVAFSSLIEILNQLIISKDLAFLSPELLLKGRAMVDNIAIKIAGLKKSSYNRKPLNP